MKKNFWSELNRPILALAPMAGITDSAFRRICREHGADIVYSEMASATALFFNPKHTLELIKFNETERPYVVQLFGKVPEHFAKATSIISNLPRSADSPLAASGLSAKPDGIDINFGCPAKKVFGHGSGCALMPQKKLAREIISAVCENTDLPVSIKIRAGLKDMNALQFIKNTMDLPYSAVMIHGRTYEDSFSGPVDFRIGEEIKKIAPDKIVLANGGIMTPEDAMKIIKDYPLLDGLGIARGAWGQPWIFNEIKKKIHPVEYFSNEKNNFASQNLLNRIKKIMIRHAELIYEDKGQKGLFEIRKHMCWYVKGFPGAAELRRKLVKAESVDGIKNILSSFQNNP